MRGGGWLAVRWSSPSRTVFRDRARGSKTFCVRYEHAQAMAPDILQTGPTVQVRAGR